MGEFPSGQRGQTVNLLAMPSMVRIHLPPPKIPITRLGGRYFSLHGRWSRSLSPSGEIHLPPPKIPIVLLDGRYFLCLLPAGTVGPCAAFSSWGRLASPSGSTAAQTLWEKPSIRAPHTPGARSRAASSRRDRPPTSVSKQSAHTVSPPRTHGHRYASSHDGSGAKHTSHRRIRVPPFLRKIIMHLDNFQP